MTLRARARTLGPALALGAALTLAGCTGSAAPDAASSAGTSPTSAPSPAESTGEPTGEPTEAYPAQPDEGYPIRPTVTVFGERALSPCRLVPVADVEVIYGSVGGVPQNDTFLERSVPYPGLARDADQALTTECTLYGSTVVSLRIDPMPRGDIGNSRPSHAAVDSRPVLAKLDAWERKSPDEAARALIDRLIEDARTAKDRDPLSSKPQRIWALTDFQSVHDFDLLTIVDRQRLELGVYSTGEPPQGRSAWVSAAGKLGQLVDLIESNLANPDLPQGPYTTTTGVTENDHGVPIPEPCSVFTPRMFHRMFGVPANAATGHGAADTTVFLSDRPTRLSCERVFEAGNLARPGPGVLARFGEGGNWRVTVEIEVYDSEKQAARDYLERRGPARHEVDTRGDQAYISYSPAFDVTVSSMRVGPFIVGVSYFGTKARSGIDFDSIELGEPPPATTIRFFDLLAPPLRDAAERG